MITLVIVKIIRVFLWSAAFYSGRKYINSFIPPLGRDDNTILYDIFLCWQILSHFAKLVYSFMCWFANSIRLLLHSLSYKDNFIRTRASDFRKIKNSQPELKVTGFYKKRVYLEKQRQWIFFSSATSCNIQSTFG